MNDIIEKDDIKIENMIYEIRGKQVMLDSDLARLYECKNGTKEINQAVKNNLDKFPERFSWILDDIEYKNLRSKNLTSSLNKNNYGGRRYKCRVFTEQGIYMLATILKSKIATEVTLNIMDTFVLMKKYISNSLIEQTYINNIVLENHYEINEIKNNVKQLTESFNNLDEKKKETEIYFHGKMFDAYYKIYQIFNESKNELIIIDNYADPTLLDIIKRLNVKVIIITKKDNLLTKQDIDKYNLQYHNLTIIYSNKFHDRYFILDKKIMYHCGTSINRIGYKTFSITLMGDKFACNNLLDYVTKIINKQY